MNTAVAPAPELGLREKLMMGLDTCGFSLDELRAGFDLVCNKDNWKLPIDSVVAATDLAVVAVAVPWFTGGHVEVQPVAKDEFRVVSEGYYHHIGA